MNFFLMSFLEMFIESFRQKKIDEFDDLRTQVFDKLELKYLGIKKEQISVIMDYELCVGRFASYSVYIPTTMIFLDRLKKIKWYDCDTIEKTETGFKIGFNSVRARNQTTRILGELKNAQ